MSTVIRHPSAGKTRGSFTRRAFSLIEMLVVIAITVVLFALLLRPLVESLRLTQSAQIQAAAQDAARTTLERITREVGSAVFVYDNASHPFRNATASSTFPGARPDMFTNFLNLEVTKSDGTPVLEHAYNAKLDIVSARQSGGTLTDPTAGNEPIRLRPGQGSATPASSGLLFPLAPTSTVIRDFVGLKRPVVYDSTGAATQGHYSNGNEGLLAAATSTEDNTYILYQAQVQPYNLPSKAKNADGTSVNESLFAPMQDNTGTVVNKPELDDPDFFRFVTASDVNWLSPTHASYSPAEVSAHNTRAANWQKIAKAVITAPDIDLLALPHKPDASIAYDTSGAFANVAHSGVSYDTVTGTAYPIVNTTVTFRPAVVEADAAPASTSDYSGLGVPANAADSGGLPYIPTLYTGSNRSWAYPYRLTLYPQHTIGSGVSADTTNFYQTDLGSNPTTGALDLIEYMYSAGSITPVYDVTSGVSIATNGQYVPLTINPDQGTIRFDQIALPDPTQPTLRFFTVNITDLNSPPLPLSGPTPPRGVVDLTQLPNSPLPANDGSRKGTQVANAHIVTGSVRVYGPDTTPGPNLGQSVLYSQVSSSTPLGFNQYRVDYLNSMLYFNVDETNQLPQTYVDGNGASQPAAPVKIAFDYQANLTPIDPANSTITTDNYAQPMLVKVDYQTRDLLDINIGIRIYDGGQGRSVTIPVSSRVRIGNSNR